MLNYAGFTILERPKPHPVKSFADTFKKRD